jgi:beta-phosphoglucomutase
MLCFRSVKLINYPCAILWDLDGTIVDTKASHFLTWQRALEKHGFVLERTVFEVNFGRNNRTLVPLFLGFQPDDNLMAEIIDVKETLFRQIAPHQAGLVPGVKTWLSKADEMSIAQAIASSAPMENIAIMLDIFNLGHYFGSIVSGAALPAKPEPDVFIQAAQTLNILPADCLVIEDSIAGVQAANQAGMRCIAVTTTHQRDELGQAAIVVDDFNTPFDEILKTLR